LSFPNQIWSEIGKGYLDGSLEKSSSRRGHYETGEALHRVIVILSGSLGRVARVLSVDAWERRRASAVVSAATKREGKFAEAQAGSLGADADGAEPTLSVFVQV